MSVVKRYEGTLAYQMTEAFIQPLYIEVVCFLLRMCCLEDEIEAQNVDHISSVAGRLSNMRLVCISILCSSMDKFFSAQLLC